ncbi:hypothetical protein [Reinekea blandensis]|uniref:ATP-grasp domain-containing protein n=1 Tax=Reinekea blandensis MED297 TaxID=314283 RepID=A4BIX0_9GAMM|nr:hypothetical protein [Reinekea blandensis]EAR07903.1 hypothetical protein MED297_15275 [Reinekea sp. MED297] [Reinekea blandensis MED297]
MTRIAFIGRKPSINNQMDKPRLGESAGLERSLLEQSSLMEADVVLVRLNPERVNHRTIRRVLKTEHRTRAGTLILNSAQYFQRYADKTQCFRHWQAAGLKTPNFTELSPWASIRTIQQSLHSLLKETDGVYLRTHNEDSGKGIHFLTRQSSGSDLKRIIKQIRRRTLTNKVTKSRLLLVGAVPNADEQGVHHVYRIHVCCGQILGGYALVGDQPVIHSRDQHLDFWSAFVHHNQHLQTILSQPQWRQQILQAAQVLGADIGAVEFFCINGELVFLELNPLWGGHHVFGEGEAFMEKLQYHRQQPELTLVNQWLTPEVYYQALYDCIGDWTDKTN